MSGRRQYRPAAALALLLLATACAGRTAGEEDDGWRPWSRMPAAGFGASQLTVPRVMGTAAPVLALEEEQSPLWPEPAPRRMPLTDPDAVARPPTARRPLPDHPAPAELYDASPFDPALLRSRLPGRSAPWP